MQKIVLALIATLVIAGCVGQTQQQVTTTGEETVTPTGLTKEFRMSGNIDISSGMFSFNKDKITVNQGDVVKIIFTTTDVTKGHTFNIDGYDVHSDVSKGGSTVVEEFFADKKGEFEYYSIIDDQKEGTGTLVVE